MRWTFGLAAISLAFAAQPAAAQSFDQNLSYCTNQSGNTSVDLQIGGCTGLIQSGQLDQGQLAAVFFARAHTYNRAGDKSRALEDYSQAITLNPSYADAYGNRGLIYADLNQHARAIEDYSRALAIRPHELDFANRGRSYQMLGELTSAIQDYNRAISVNSQFTLAYRFRATAFQAQQNYAQAVADFTTAIGLEPQNAEIYVDRGHVYANVPDYERAFADFNEAVRLSPQYAMAFNNRGWIYAQRGDLNAAIADYDRAIGLDPNFTLALDNRADAYASRRDYGRAIADDDRLTQLTPTNPWAFNQACWHRAVSGLQLQAARAACDTAIRMAASAEDRASFLDSRGLVNLKDGRFEDAWNDYNSALAISPESAHFLYGRGAAALALGRIDGQADISRATGMQANIATTYAGYGVTP